MLIQVRKPIRPHSPRAQHSALAKKQIVIGRRAIVGTIALLALLPELAVSQTLSNSAFNIQYGAGGLTSLKRANDKYDTEYISNAGSLGNIVIQYRTSANSGWTTVREIGPGATTLAGGNTINYSVGTLLPT